MIENIINRLEKIDLRLATFVSKSHKIYKWFNINPFDKSDLILSKYNGIDIRVKPNNIICPDIKLYGDVTIPEITLNDKYLAVNGTGFNIPTIYPFFAITEGCKFLLNYNYTDYPYTCVCQVFDLKNYTGKVIKTFGGDFKTHYDFIKYVKKHYGFGKSCYMPYKNRVDMESSRMDTYRDALGVDLENDREEIITSIAQGVYNKSWIPMLDIKAAIINSPIHKFTGDYISLDPNKVETTLNELQKYSIEELKAKFSNFGDHFALNNNVEGYIVDNVIIFIDIPNEKSYALRFKNNQIVGYLIENPFNITTTRVGTLFYNNDHRVYNCNRCNRIIIIPRRSTNGPALIIDSITLNSYVTLKYITSSYSAGSAVRYCTYKLTKGNIIRVENNDGRVIQLINLIDGDVSNT